MVLIGIAILILSMCLVYVAALAYNDKNGQMTVFALAISVVSTAAAVAIIMHEAGKMTTTDVKEEVLQYLHITGSVTLTLTDDTFTYQLNDSTMVDLFNYLTVEDDTNE